MADSIKSIFKNKKINLSRLVQFGFVHENEVYVYRRNLLESGFIMIVTVTSQGTVSAQIIDFSTSEPYTLHLADGATGSFVGKVRLEYEQVLSEIASECFEREVFKTEYAKELISYVRTKYGDELEFLWQKFSDNAIWRRKDTGKWYGALLIVSKRKLGIASDEIVEIIDFRINPEYLSTLIDKQKYYPGYHMNKKSWCTIILDGTVTFDEICSKVDESYRLAVK